MFYNHIYVFPILNNELIILFLLGCVVNGVAGDGTTKGSCTNPTDLCTVTGQCLGNINIITHTEILQNIFK